MTCPVTLTLPATSFCGLAIFIVRAVFSIIISPSKSICGSTNNTRIIDINVQGEIDADIQGTFQGQMKVSVDSVIPGRQGQVTYDNTEKGDEQ